MIRGVDHINIATRKLAETRAFYVDALGLHEGPRPPFASPGYWLYAGDRPVVHMQEAAGPVLASDASALNHAAFLVDDMDAALARLGQQGVPYELTTIPGTMARQAFFRDPNGVRLELNGAPETPLDL